MHYLSILLKMFTGDAKITHNESFKDDDCSIAMSIAIVLFHCVHLSIFLWFCHFDY